MRRLLLSVAIAGVTACAVAPAPLADASISSGNDAGTDATSVDGGNASADKCILGQSMVGSCKL
jgi:hypothetical protein